MSEVELFAFVWSFDYDNSKEWDLFCFVIGIDEIDIANGIYNFHIDMP